ncbi:MAG: cytochrome c oxidase assembly protein [Blastomonas fulva]|jgi:cytochrome c oxidase assembly protein subunit 11|uniref:Cytochrome c oxidase assembly protein CtaG n=2 Tax=Blastomonas fulva TaxID=1550728 RepID=A0ABN5B5H4_9SPHN|nr:MULTISPECIES: cytochrome c oxidase assembly protein [Blastomonas]AOG01046.1 cytochrome c oxidase assembly CtaG/Cox11 family protein [Blastomonas sp. RAC04]ASR52066.1 cytochrome c oxidase assembly protein [Blastomonas fulva]KPF77399.1 cytochrome C oxidase assembly protein [Blastomonas sp. AAP25]MCO5794124.1 cytochrome c oxidase assembly protein [Blastomonas sp.]MDK2757146.1 cytochrome c oxidase assembly protein [Blastomonas fulva]
MNAATLSPDVSRRNRKAALLALCFAGGMLGMGYAAVPLYRIFCEATGFGGTTMKVSEETASAIAVTDKQIVVRFDSNVSSALPWRFKPENPTEKITIGARDMAAFVAENLSSKPVTGTATFNVTPVQAGRYFAKVQCFCFTEQTLQPGEKVRMPVIYYVDPAILTDPDTKDIEEITLSYTFYPLDQAKKGS